VRNPDHNFSAGLKKLIAAALAILAVLIALRLLTSTWHGGYDARFYRAMAVGPFSSVPAARTAPYCWRLLPAVPVYLLPLPVEKAWPLFNFAAIFLSALILFRLLEEEGGSLTAAGLGVFFYLFSWVNVRFAFFYPCQTDSAYYLFLVLAFWSLLRRKDWLFFSALCLASLTREYFLALIPAYYLSRRERPGLFDPAALCRTALVSLLPLILFILPRLLISLSNPDFSYLGHGAEFLRITIVHWRRTLYSFANVYGAALFVVILHLPDAFRYLKRRPEVAVYIPFWFLFLAVGGSDLDRINFIGFPVVMLLAAAAVAARSRLYRNKFILAYLAAAHLILMRVFTRMGPEPDNWRRLWWSSISFMPEEVFRSKVLLFLFLLAGFFLLAFSVSFLRRRRRNSALPARPLVL